MPVSIHPIKSALISVFDKSGLDLLGPALHSKGVQLYSTGGTADYLEKTLSLPVTRVEKVTGFPEMMDGRVKTLHPKVFGGILARRYQEKDLLEAKEFGIPLFDLVVVNLYPFWKYLGKSVEEQSSQVDIGGPAMLRAASKNHTSVTVLSSPEDYTAFLEEWKTHTGTTLELRKELAAKTFSRTSEYDGLISSEWGNSKLPYAVSLSPHQKLRYGENPHQAASWVPGRAAWKVLQGKELSYNNLLDSEAAARLVAEFDVPSVAIIKHNNPCGCAAFNGNLDEVFEKALESDSVSAFGGVVAVNREIDLATAQKMSKIFLEVIIAPGFSNEAKTLFAEKKNLRLIEWPNPTFSSFEVRAAMGGWLIQETDLPEKKVNLEPVTTKRVDAKQTEALQFAWKVAKHVRSNAIVLANGSQTVGIGAGQMSRVDAVRIALEKANGKTSGAVLASDAFFPFRDNIDLLKNTGVSGIVQPGGSQRDGEVIQACEEHGIAMVFTGQRHFRH